ncbi:MAG: sigma-70 family RNA polymerase sigma factor [Verrucomicrobiae bacterium]|nr:sigma-70 family RNA polymerase sigma factor [Verrucomicrobiae bacterium]
MSPLPTIESACTALYEESAARLLLYARSLGLSHSEAEDVLHEVFAALLALGRLPDNPVHYLLRSVRNRAINHRRSLLRRLSREFESHRWFEVSPSESPHERAAMKCLEALPREQREVIVLKIWHRRTFEEIAELLGLPASTAAGRYRYGMNRLRTCLLQEQPQSPHEHEPLVGTIPGLLDPA